jgi:hypothetical protein
LTASALIYLLAKLPLYQQAFSIVLSSIYIVLEGFKKVSIALVGAFGLAGAVFFGFKVAGAL